MKRLKIIIPLLIVALLTVVLIVIQLAQRSIRKADFSPLAAVMMERLDEAVRVPLPTSAEEEARRSLENTANDILLLIEEGQPQQLLSYLSERGVIFGPDEPPTSLAIIRADLEQKRGVYCAFFDTQCVQTEDVAARAKARAHCLASCI